MKQRKLDVAVIGGGAAGFFAAIRIAEYRPGTQVIIFEKTSKLLSKVAISGGGRCNVTHDPDLGISQMAAHYPRGQGLMKRLLKSFDQRKMWDWLSSKGVALKVEADGRVFPQSNKSQSIIACFLSQCEASNIEVKIREGEVTFRADADGFEIEAASGMYHAFMVVVASGGGNKAAHYEWLQNHGHQAVAPIPSLFTLNIPHSSFKDLAGLSVHGAIKITGTKFEEHGSILITHWGLSGPAVLRLSAFAAEHFNRQEYRSTILVRWIPALDEDMIRNFLLDQKIQHPKRLIQKYPHFEIPKRLWIRLCELAGIEEHHSYGETGHKAIRKLVEHCLRSPLEMEGKTTFKEEFVISGGVALDEIYPSSMESKFTKGLFFAGEILNIDGVTGGFNFQAAWSTADAAASAIAERLNEISRD